MFSPPMSPTTDDPGTFPYEEMTARFCIGGGRDGNSEATATTSSSSTSSSLHSGTTIVSKVPNTKHKQVEEKDKPKTTSTTFMTSLTSSGIGKEPNKPIGSGIVKSASSILTTSNIINAPHGPASTTMPTSTHLITPSEVKILGRETKGANIAGLIKSKTADFEKIAKESQAAAAASSAQPPSKIASSMRLSK